jgi:hypothetical protein
VLLRLACLPVVADGRLLGMFDTTDACRGLAEA